MQQYGRSIWDIINWHPIAAQLLPKAAILLPVGMLISLPVTIPILLNQIPATGGIIDDLASNNLFKNRIRSIIENGVSILVLTENGVYLNDDF